jgi:NADPH:quinone reductase-like Zn-dependent oxidoreductase
LINLLISQSISKKATGLTPKQFQAIIPNLPLSLSALPFYKCYYCTFVSINFKMTIMKTALIIGGNSGIGKATTLQLAQQGIEVHVVGVTENKLNEAKVEIEK